MSERIPETRPNEYGHPMRVKRAMVDVHEWNRLCERVENLQTLAGLRTEAQQAAEAERDALTVANSEALLVLRKHGARGGYAAAVQEARRILAAEPSAVLAEHDARVWSEGVKAALLAGERYSPVNPYRASHPRTDDAHDTEGE